MRPLAVLAEALTVIAGDDDEGAFELAGGGEVREELADRRVGVSHLRIVRRVL